MFTLLMVVFAFSLVICQDQVLAESCCQETTDGRCCVFPFIHKGKRYYSCTTANFGNIPWCSTTSNYDKDRYWGKCKVDPECSHKTTAGICCAFPFIYQKKIYNNCTTVNNDNIPWCATTRNYDKNGKWGRCKQECSRKTTDGVCCVFPFLYKGKCYNVCTNVFHHIPWCATTSNYKDGKWGECR